jgi:O-antigen biosynthesis protein
MIAKPANRISYRIAVDGKFFSVADARFFIKGVTYGPFRPGNETPERVRLDFQLMRELRVNTVRVYHPPPRWFLDLASDFDLRLLVDVPWPRHLCFLDSPDLQRQAREAVRECARTCADHPAVLALNVASEIPPDIVRWSGARRVNRFLEELIEEAKSIENECLCTFTSFPPTEFLRADNADFASFNVYLHHRSAFENYLARLQMLAGGKPLLLGEFGLDTIRHGQESQTEMLAWQIESAFRSGVGGTILFGFTDDWFTGGQQVEDWAFGITTADRTPKRAFAAVKQQYQRGPYFPLPRTPKVSVVVATYNGARTLKVCLDSLTRLNYPDYEVIVVDDGSSDASPEIAQRYPQFHYLRQANHGLAVARNSGIAAARGEIIAFTDSDCRADPDWLYYLVGDLLAHNFDGIGGHNFLPPEDSATSAAVMAAPGGPAHVMFTDREAEHVPGCNMAFYRRALIGVGGFDPVFRRAGDDVDVCWRLLEHGYRIGFSSSGFVWHYRRSNVAAYLKQQSGYGEAEALLARKHPEYFNLVGVSTWRGRIYGSANYGVLLQRPVIYRGLFGSALFQKLYTPEPAHVLMLLTSLEYHVFLTLPLFVLSLAFRPMLPVAIASLLLSVAVCVTAAAQADLPRKQSRFWSRPLVALLFFLQPIVRGWARHRWRWTVQSPAGKPHDVSISESEIPEVVSYWYRGDVNRLEFLRRLLDRLDTEGWQHKTDTGWGNFDLEVFGDRWSRLRLTTMGEELADRQKIVRCRLRPSWSLRARVAFWFLVALELLIIRLFAPAQPWLWMLLLTLPLVIWFLDQEKWRLTSQILAGLDQIAADLKWTRLGKTSETANSEPALNQAPA